MNTKTSFSYSLITLTLWSTYSFGADSNNNFILGGTTTYGASNKHNIIAGEGTNLYSNAKNNIMNTTGNPIFGGSYSLVIGHRAGHEAGKYSGNTKYLLLVGEHAGESTWETSQYKFIFGNGAGWNAGGTYVYAFGKNAARQMNGNYNFSFGENSYSADTITKGHYNFNFGQNSGYNNSGSRNVNIGFHAGESYTTDIKSGDDNFALGHSAGQNVTGNHNFAYGQDAGTNTSGSRNIALGQNAGQNVKGNYNYAFGLSAGQNIDGFIKNPAGTTPKDKYGQSVGWNNIAFGKESGNSIIGNFNLAFAERSGRYVGYKYKLTAEEKAQGFAEPTWIADGDGRANSYISNVAKLKPVDGAEHNIALGFNAGNLIAGQDNFAVGVYSGNKIIGESNIALGKVAGNEIEGNFNTVLGYNSGSNVVGNSNFVAGAEAGKNVRGNNNYAAGYQVGNDVTGDNNLAMGKNAGNKLTGNDNISIGHEAGVEYMDVEETQPDGTKKTVRKIKSGLTVNYAIAVGKQAIAKEENAAAFGNGSKASIADSVAIGSNTTTVSTSGSYTMGTDKTYNSMEIDKHTFNFAGGKNVVSVFSVGNETETRRIQHVGQA